MISSGGYAIPFPRQQPLPQTTTMAGTMPAMMVTQATSPISPSSPLISAARARSAAAVASKESEEDELESLTSNEGMLESGSIKEAKVREMFQT